MDPSLSDRDPVEELAEEFVERYRRGERTAQVSFGKSPNSRVAGQFR